MTASAFRSSPQLLDRLRHEPDDDLHVFAQTECASTRRGRLNAKLVTTENAS
jgi:hypothetical protein